MSRLERVQLVLSTPRPLRVLVSALQHANGLELRMLSGDFTAFWSRLQVSDEEGLTALNWEQVFDLPVNVPGTLLKELRTEVVPGILARLLSEEASHE